MLKKMITVSKRDTRKIKTRKNDMEEWDEGIIIIITIIKYQ